MRGIIAWSVAALLLSHSAKAETPEEWVQLGTRVHGFFGGFIPAGIRIGLDAQQRLHAVPRSLSVLYYLGAKAPCPCLVDGVMLAVQASPGQGTVQVASEWAPVGLMAVVVIRDLKSGEGLRYAVSDEWLPKMLAWNKDAPLKRRGNVGRGNVQRRTCRGSLISISTDPVAELPPRQHSREGGNPPATPCAFALEPTVLGGVAAEAV